MKIICILNMVALAVVLGGNFELSDLPYFRGIIQNAWECLTGIIKNSKTEAEDQGKQQNAINKPLEQVDYGKSEIKRSITNVSGKSNFQQGY
jgi:hypothetical protein